MMRIRINFEEKDVVERGKGYVEIECDPRQATMTPAFVHVFEPATEGVAEKHHGGHHLVVGERGGLKLSKYPEERS